ncbi:hypothetical protein FH972_007505 [Carpinus fangiana]|uniref:Uncharacterized protein n=1 Tax=Carpinus fangiana TaxID=176857 RepID=A0A5N6QYT9_9ROSI|nr:hypothetical protein FH972_007505 [Carpinus fangiana]
MANGLWADELASLPKWVNKVLSSRIQAMGLVRGCECTVVQLQKKLTSVDITRNKHMQGLGKRGTEWDVYESGQTWLGIS